MTKRTREIITFIAYSTCTMQLGAAISERKWWCAVPMLLLAMYFAYRLGRGED